MIKQEHKDQQHLSQAQDNAQEILAPTLTPPPFQLLASAGETGMEEEKPDLELQDSAEDKSIQHAEAPSDPAEGGGNGEGTPWEPPKFTHLMPPAFNLKNGGGDKEDASKGESKAQPETNAKNGTAVPPNPAQPPQAGVENGPGGEGSGGIEKGAPFEQGPVALDNSSSGALVQSLGQQQPSAIVTGMKQVGTQLPGARAQEKTKAEAMLPKIQQPTGLSASQEGDTANPDLSVGKEPELKTAASGQKQIVPKKHVQSNGPVPSRRVPTPPAESMSTPAGLRSAVRNIPSSDGEVNTSAGPRPKVELTGDLNPARNAQAEQTSQSSVDQDKARNDAQIQKDFGENNMFPSLEPEEMQATTELTEGQGFTSSASALPQMDATTANALNAGILGEYQDELSTELDKQTQGEADYQAQAEAEQQKGLADIDAETAKIKEQQLAAQQKGRADIEAHRQSWKQENEAVNAEFKQQSASKRREIEGQIDAKVRETNSKVESEYANAEGKARQEQQKANQKVAAEKAKAAEKEKDKSWWDRAVDAVGDFFESLKNAVSAIFDALRDLVSSIIEKAKALAGQLIDFARDAIKGMIDAFADALKAFVRVALAAFPGIAEKFCNLIDQAVEFTKQAIDQLAEGLKMAVQFILDAVGGAINALLSAYEAIINGILSAIEGLVLIWLKIMKGIANLVMAAGGMPDMFMGQASEELLGTDVTTPLKNEYPADTVPTAAPALPAADEIQNTVQQVTPDAPDSTMQLLQKQSYTENDFDVPALSGVQLDPALMQQFSQMGEGTHEFAQFNDDAHGIDALKAELGYDPNAVATGVEEAEMATGPQSVQTPAVAGPAAALDPGRDRFTPDAAGKVGPFSVGERTKHVAGQMWTGIKTWVSENMGKIILGVIGVITGAVLLNILTGGAIMAALPLIMQLVSAYFAAEAVVKMGAYFGKYLTKSFPGDIVGGSKALARGMAIGAIELVFALAFGGKAAFKAVKGGAKTLAKGGVKGLAKSGVSLAKQGVKNTAKNAVKLGKVMGKGIKTAGQNIVKGGKFVMNGVKRGAIAGAKSLDNLGKKLGKLTKFRGFRIVISGRRWRLEGKMNPWVLLANGDVEFVDAKDLKFKGPHGGKGGLNDVGRKVSVNNKPGIIIDPDEIGKGIMTENLMTGSKGAAQETFQQLDQIGTVAGRKKQISNTVSEVTDDVLKARLKKDLEKLFNTESYTKKLQKSIDEGLTSTKSSIRNKAVKDQKRLQKMIVRNPNVTQAAEMALEMGDEGRKFLDELNWARGAQDIEVDAAIKKKMQDIVDSIPATATPDDLKRIARELETIRNEIPEASKVVQPGALKTGSPSRAVTPTPLKELPENLASARTLELNRIHFMQNSISNPTGEFFVLQNVLSISGGTLKKQFLGPVRTWVSKVDGKIWTLDHRRLAAYKLAGIDDVPIKWADQAEVLGDAFKMSTSAAQDGKTMTIRMFIKDGKFVKNNTRGATPSNWEIVKNAKGGFDILDDLNQLVTPERIKELIP